MSYPCLTKHASLSKPLLSSAHNASSMRTTTQRPWELQLPQWCDINVSAPQSSCLWRLCRTAYVMVRLCVDARTLMSAHTLWPWSAELGWGLGLSWAAAAGTDSRGRAGKVATNLSPKDSDLGDDPECSMLLVDVLWCSSPFLCATLFYVVTKIILSLYHRVCVSVCAALRTGSSGDALTPPTIDITMESPSYWATVPNPPLCPPTNTWKTTILLSYVCTGQLVGIFTNAGSIMAESGHISFCMCVSMHVWGQWRDDGKAKRCTHTHLLLSWHVWG